MAEKNTSWVKWLLIGCGGCLLLSIILVVVVVVGVQRFAKSGGFKEMTKLTYEDPPAVDVADKVEHPEYIEVFLDLKSAADAGIKTKKVIITEGEMNAFIADAMKKSSGSKPMPEGLTQVVMDFKENGLALYFSVDPGRAVKFVEGLRVSYLFSYELVKQAPPFSFELKDLRMGPSPVPPSQWKAQTDRNLQSYRKMEERNPAMARIFEMMGNGLILSRDITDVQITDKSLTYTLK